MNVKLVWKYVLYTISCLHIVCQYYKSNNAFLAMFIHYIIRYCLLFIVYCVVRLSEGKCTKAVVKYKASANSVTA